MFDGYAGDVCDYTIAPITGVNILAVSPANPTICSGESVSLTASGGGGTYTWAGPSLNTTSGPTVMANPLVTSSYAVTSADPNGICPITINVVVTVTNTPNPPIVTSPVNLCQNSSASPLNATGTNLLWYNAATGGIGSNIAPTPNTSLVGSITYYVSQTLSCGESVRVPISVNITAGTPAPAVSGPVSYCQNAVATALTATGNSLSWYFNATGGIGDVTAPIPSTTIAGTTTYYVSQSSSCGESPRSSISVTINPTPSQPVASAISYCQNGATNPLIATGQNLLWYTSSSGGIGSNIAPTPSSAVIGNTNYYVSQTINGCEGPRANIIVTITASTPAPGVISLINYCEDATASPLTAVGTSLLWYASATGGIGSNIAPIPSTNIPGATNYYVSQTTNCGEGPRATITVNINPIPAPPTISSNVSYCINESAVPLTANGSNLLWYNTSIGGTGVPSLIPSTNAVGSISYYVSQTLLGCESPRASIDVNVTGLPPAPTVGTTSYTYCQLSTAAQLSATGTGLLWYTSIPGSGTGIAPIPSTSTSGIFNYYVTQTLSCGESQPSTIVVTVNPTPLAPLVNSPVVYCQGAIPNILSASGTNLLWYTSSTGGLGNNNAPTPSTVSVGNIPFYVSSTTGSCEGPRAEIIVTVNITPDAPTVSSPLLYCKGNSATPLTANGTLLSWYNAPTGGIASSVSPTPSTLNTGSTIYYVSQTTGVCEGPRSSINVEVLTTPNIGSDKKDTICFGGSYNLTPVFNTNGLSVLWTYGGNNVTNSYAVDIAGNYQIEVTNNNGCKDTANFMLNIRPPVIAKAGNDTIAVKGQPHQLFGNGGDRYVWSPAALLNQSTAQNPLATLSNDQLFVLTVFNTIGCSDKDSVFIKVYKGPNEFVPNAFTPDGDGLNDIFRPIPVGIKKTAWFRVYNRTGQLLFESNRWLDGWDGKYQNKKQPTGSYVWALKYSIDGVNYQIMKGAVLLLR
jgi:gliding motility-associated-like protein